MNCNNCEKELVLGHFTLAHCYPDFYPNPPLVVEGDAIWVVQSGGKVKTYCSKEHALSESTVIMGT